MKDKIVIITGASDGIGAVTAKVLHEKGATVVVVGRSPEKTERVAESIQSDYYIADFSKLDEVRTLAEKLKATYPKIDILINNAGGIFSERALTEDGNEKTLQVNHLAPFLLTNLLMDTLIKSKATIINTSSIANERFAKFDIRDIQLTKGYTSNRAYGNAKLANILFTRQLHERYHAQGINSVAVHPGTIATNFASDSNSVMRYVYRSFLAKILLDTVEKGAEPLIWLATHTPGKEWESGQYYDRFKIGRVHKVAADPSIAVSLWEQSKSLTNL